MKVYAQWYMRIETLPYFNMCVCKQSAGLARAQGAAVSKVGIRGSIDVLPKASL